MDKLFLTALILWALCFAVTDCGAAKVQSPQPREMKTENASATPTVLLTQEHPKASVPVAASVLTTGPEVLEVAITKVINPNKAQIAIFVYLSNTNKGKTEPEKTEIGNFTLYPPDQAGKFLLSAGPALRTLATKAVNSKADVQLVLEMKRLDETKPWTQVEVTIAQPKWRAAEE